MSGWTAKGFLGWLMGGGSIIDMCACTAGTAIRKKEMVREMKDFMMMNDVAECIVVLCNESREKSWIDYLSLCLIALACLSLYKERT